MGFDTYNIGPELEFFYFASDELGEDGVPTILDKGGYFDLTTLDAGSDLRRDTVNALKAVGIPVEYTHHEVGPSQHEIDMRYAEGLRMSDNAMTYRIVVKEIAHQHGVYATFMPKPLFGENGSGHAHPPVAVLGRLERLLRRRRRPPPVGRGEGVHRRPAPPRARDRGAVRAQREQLQAPGARLRGAGLLRLVAAQPLGPGAGPGLPPGQGAGDALRAALPGPLVQPLPDLRGDAARRAGRDRAGLRVPGADGANLYELTHDERVARGIEQLPETLGEAIEELAGSELVRKALGDHIFERYVDLKREEWEEYRVQVTRWELERYLPIL